MNLITTPRAELTAALLAVEGIVYAVDIGAELTAAESWCANAGPTATEWALYGLAGYHRYYVYPDGRIVYSAHHGPGEVDEARAAGFEVLT